MAVEMTLDPPPKRKPGRPRDPTADHRILAAARAVAAEVGVHGASMSAIADRSGTGKPTIYLRWPDIPRLMVAAIEDLDVPVEDPPGATARVALLAALADDREFLVSGPHARFLRSVLFESAGEPSIADALERRILGPRRDRLRRILERGAAAGQVRPGIEPAPFADLLLAAVVREGVLGGAGEAAAAAVHAAVAATADPAAG